MNTSTIVPHSTIWKRDFWFLILANLCISMSIYMLVPIIPVWLLGGNYQTHIEVGITMGSYGLGLFVMGPFCNWLVQTQRRNVVCLSAILVIVICILSFWFLQQNISNIPFSTLLFYLLRFCLGMAFGLVQMVLSSTLIIDKCQSTQRTEANYVSTWFGRFALSLGPMIGIVLSRTEIEPLWGAAMLALGAFILIRSVNFPFKAPEDNPRITCTDRFFLPNAKWLFFNLLIINIIIGIIFTIEFKAMFYGLIMVGFCCSLLAERFVFVNADLESEIVTGILLIVLAVIMLLVRTEVEFKVLPPILIGLGLGLIASRFLLFFIKLSKHCQRGTALSTYILSWESGIAVGLWIGYTFVFRNEVYAYTLCLVILFIAFLIYHFFVHSWYINHKNR